MQVSKSYLSMVHTNEMLGRCLVMGDESRTEASPYGTGVSAWHLSVTDVTCAALAVTRGRGDRLDVAIS